MFECIFSSCFTSIPLGIGILFLIYKFLTYNYHWDEKIGCPGPKPVLFLGNSWPALTKGFHKLDVTNRMKYGNVYPFYFGLTASIVISDEAALKQILVKDAKNFIDRPSVPGRAKLTNKNLLRLTGKDWERVRALVTPTFTSGKLKKMSPMIIASIENMQRKFAEHVGQKADIKKIFQSLTMDVIGKTMFGIDLDVFQNPSHPFLIHANKLFSFKLLGILVFVLSFIPYGEYLASKIFPYGITAPDSMRFFEKSLTKTIEMRKKSTEKYHDFLALMIKAHEDLLKIQKENQPNSSESKVTENYKGLTEEEIMAQSIVFLLAGFETTASTLTFCSYYLATNPEVQEEVYQQIKSVLGDKEEVDYEDLTNLPLLDQCLNEALRICPPVIRFARKCTKETIVTTSKGQVINIPKGMSITIPAYAIHHDPSIYPNPEKFDIHRFDPEVKQQRSQFHFLPFGAGPRSCIGMRFAQMETKMALIYVLRAYKLVQCAETPKILEFGIGGLTQVKTPIIIKIEARS